MKKLLLWNRLLKQRGWRTKVMVIASAVFVLGLWGFAYQEAKKAQEDKAGFRKLQSATQSILRKSERMKQVNLLVVKGNLQYKGELVSLNEETTLFTANLLFGGLSNIDSRLPEKLPAELKEVGLFVGEAWDRIALQHNELSITYGNKSKSKINKIAYVENFGEKLTELNSSYKVFHNALGRFDEAVSLYLPNLDFKAEVWTMLVRLFSYLSMLMVAWSLLIFIPKSEVTRIKKEIPSFEVIGEYLGIIKSEFELSKEVVSTRASDKDIKEEVTIETPSILNEPLVRDVLLAEQSVGDDHHEQSIEFSPEASTKIEDFKYEPELERNEVFYVKEEDSALLNEVPSIEKSSVISFENNVEDLLTGLFSKETEGGFFQEDSPKVVSETISYNFKPLALENLRDRSPEEVSEDFLPVVNAPEADKESLAPIAGGTWALEIPADLHFTIHTPFMVSEKMRVALGRTQGRMANRFGMILKALHPQEKYLFLQVLRAHLKDPFAVVPFAIDCRLMMADKNWKWFRFVGNTVRDDDGNPLRTIGQFFDVTSIHSVNTEDWKQTIDDAKAELGLDNATKEEALISAGASGNEAEETEILVGRHFRPMF